MAKNKRVAWGMWVIVGLVVVVGGLMSIRPDKLVSERLPAGALKPNQMALAVYAELGDERQELRGPVVRLPAGTRFRVRLLMSDTRKLSVGVQAKSGAFKSALLSGALPPGVHTFRKTIELQADDELTVMAGPPIPFEDARAGKQVDSVHTLKIVATRAPQKAVSPPAEP